MDYVNEILKAIAIYSIILMVFGTIGNIFSIYICFKRKLREVPTFIFYLFLLMSDTISLFWWNMDHYLLIYNNYQIEDLGLFACRATTFFQLFSFQWSAWLLVTMTLERYLSITIKQWRSYLCKIKLTLCLAILIGIFFIALNSYFALNVNYNENLISNITCFGADNYSVWMLENNYAYSFIPFTIMIITNCLLITRMKSSRVRVHDDGMIKLRNRKATSLTVLITTTLFIVLTAPDAIANAFFVPMLFETRLGTAILFACDSLAFTFHSSNCITLYYSNKQFSREVKRLTSTFFYKNQQVGTTRTIVQRTNNNQLTRVQN